MSNIARSGFRSVWGVAVLAVTLFITTVALYWLRTSFSFPNRLSPGRTLTRQIRRTELHWYELELPANTFVNVEVDQQEIDVSLIALRPDGTSLAEIDYGAFGRETLSILAERAGVYRVGVRAQKDSTAQGVYEIATTQPSVATLDDLKRIRAQELFSDAEKQQSRATAASSGKAISLYQQAARQWHEAADRRGEAHALFALGIAFDRTGHWQDAYDCYTHALRLSQELNDEYGRLQCLRQLGRLSGHLGDRFAFVPSDLEFVHSWQRLRDRRGVAHALSVIAARYAGALNDPHKALEYATQALAIQRNLGDRLGERKTLESIVQGNMGLKDFEKARTIAFDILQLSREANDRRGEAASLDRIGQVLAAAGQNREAIPYFKKALTFREAQGDLSAQADLNLILAGLYMQLREPLEALPHMRATLTIEDSLRVSLKKPKWREGFSGDLEFAGGYVQALMRLHEQSPQAGYDAEAFLAADRPRARLLVDQTPEAGNVALVDLQRQLLDDQSVLLQYSLSRHDPAEEKEQAKANVQDALPSFVWAVTCRSLSVYRLPSRHQIEKLARRAYEILAQSNPSSSAVRMPKSRTVDTADAEPLLALSQILLAPLASQLHAKRLLIASDGILQYLPFSALPDPTSPDHDPLVKHHEITILPSASGALFWQRRAAKRTEPSHLLALLADPIFDPNDPRVRGKRLVARGSDVRSLEPDLSRAAHAVGLETISRLPYSRREAAGALAFVPHGQSLVLLDSAATRDALLNGQLANYRIVHIATHGFVNDEDPELSGLVLSRADSNGHPIEGFVRLRDLDGLRLPIDLLVLSACQSAIGKEIRGTGILSLPGSFLHAGATNVLATAWKIDDEATAEFMKAFYSELLGPHHRSPAAALQAAQVFFSAHPRWHSPYYWAGFVLYGPGR